MRFSKHLSLRWRLLAGFMLAASMTVLSGVSGIISLQRIHDNMSTTSHGVDSSVRQQTEQTNTAVILRDLIDEIKAASSELQLSQTEEKQVTVFIDSNGETVQIHEVEDIKSLVAAKRRQLESLQLLTEADRQITERLNNANQKISDIVDSVIFAVLLGIEDEISSVQNPADVNATSTASATERLANYVDTGLTKIKVALTARTSLLELNLAFKETLLSQDPDVPKSRAETAEDLYANLGHQLSPLSNEEGIEDVKGLIKELQDTTPAFMNAKTSQIVAEDEFEVVYQDVLNDVRLRSLAVVKSAKELESEVGERFQGSSRFTTRSMVFLISISLTAFVLSILIGVHMARSFATSITAVVTRVKDVADGDLSQGSIETMSADEIGSLAEHINVMVKNLKTILGSTQEVAAQINNTGQEILSISDAQSAGAREQSCAVSQTTSAAAELSKTSEQIGENIKTISQMANHVLTGMGKIKEATDQTNQILTSLNDKSKQIGNITELIDDVADQTNLLAVNASIEAARAGEQGRGFTVVADQISKLADSTAKSTKDITGLVEMIQHEMSNAIIAMEQSLVGVEEEIQLAKDSAAKSQEIAMSANQQISGSRQIAEAMSSIDQTMKQIVFGSQRSSEAASQLTGLADELKACMSKFRVSQNVGNSFTHNNV